MKKYAILMLAAPALIVAMLGGAYVATKPRPLPSVTVPIKYVGPPVAADLNAIPRTTVTPYCNPPSYASPTGHCVSGTVPMVAACPPGYESVLLPSSSATFTHRCARDIVDQVRK